jgi:hypothetical protein
MKRLMVCASLLAIVSGCATPYQPVPYDRAAAGVTKVVVVEDAMPDEAGTQKLATNGQNMASALGASAGLAGVLVGAAIAGVEAGIEAGQRNKIRAALATQKFDGEAVFDAALEKALKDHNYTVGSISVTRETARGLVKLTPNPNAEPGSAILDVAGFNYGYQLVGGGTQWRPFVTIQAQLTDPKDPTKILLQNFVTYNPVAKPDVMVNIPPDERFAFAKIEDIEADPAKAAEGLRVALEASAIATANLLR